MPQANDGYIYGLDKLYFGGVEVGYISEEGLTPTGDAASTTPIRAAQARNAVVKILQTQSGTIKFEFTMIQMLLDKVAAVFGGTVVGGVYDAPRASAPSEGRAFIKCFSGHKLDAPKATLTGNLAGAINLGGVLSIKCTMEIQLPDDETKGPFQLYDPGAIVPNDPSEPTEG